jgi:phosphatidylglycerophosphate synthase
MLHYSGWSLYYGIEPVNMLLCAIVTMGSLLVPYVRARAESQGLHCEVGVAERAERVIIFAGGLVLGFEVAALWALAFLTNFTVIQRLHHVHAQLRYEHDTAEAPPLDREKFAAHDVKSDI